MELSSCPPLKTVVIPVDPNGALCRGFVVNKAIIHYITSFDTHMHIVS